MTEEQGIMHLLEQAQNIVGGISDASFQSLCAADIAERQSVVNSILTQLNAQEEATQADVLQSLPIAMLQDGRHIETLQFMELCIERGGHFAPEVVAHAMRTVNTEMLIIREGGEDDTSVETLDVILKNFYNTILNHDQYRENPGIFIIVGINFDEAGNIPEAIRFYTHAIGLGSPEASIYAADAYEKMRKYSESATVLDTAYKATGEQRFLQKYIGVLSKSGKRTEAYTHYLELKSKNTKFENGHRVTTLPPFIVFTEEIHSDHDLREFELLLTEYHKGAAYLPFTYLRNLAENASIYISNEIEKIDTFLQSMSHSPVESWTEEQAGLYMESIKRRLYLMQTHIIMLQDQRYLDVYIHELRKYTVDGNHMQHKLMRRFFMEHSSLYTRAAYNHVTGGDGEDEEKIHLLEDVRIHLVHIEALFSQGTFYETIRDDIEPLIDLCVEQSGTSTDVSIEDADGEFHYTDSGVPLLSTADIESEEDSDMRVLRIESQEFEKFSASTQQLYEDFVGFIDERYGMFYRRSLQQLVRDNEAMPPSLMGAYKAAMIKCHGDEGRAYAEVIGNMSVFLENPYIALFYFIEKILLGEDFLEEGQSMEQWLLKYQLNSIGPSDTLCLASMLYEKGYHDDATEYLIHVSGMLEVPQALYMIIESLRWMSGIEDDEEGEEEAAAGEESQEEIEGEKDTDKNKNVTHMIQVLDDICKENYGVETFSEYFRQLTEDQFTKAQDAKAETNDEEIGYLLLASANMKIFQDGDKDEIIAEFTAAGDYGIVGGYIGAGDFLQVCDRYDEAISVFILAHQLSPSIITIKRLADAYMSAGKYDDAWQILDDATRSGYDVVGYKVACYLYEGRIKECIHEFSKMLRGVEYIDMDFPDGFSDDILSDIQMELNQPLCTGEQFGTAILGSYIRAGFVSGSAPLDTKNYLRHITFIYQLLDTYSIQEASQELVKSLPLLTGIMPSSRRKSIETLALDILQNHLIKIHGILVGHHKENIEKKDAKAARKSFVRLDAYMKTARTIIQKFPDAHTYLNVWERGLNFKPREYYIQGIIHEMPSTIQ